MTRSNSLRDEPAVDWVRIADVRKLDELERLHPHDYARLVATPATGYDLLTLRLELAEQFRIHHESVQEAFDKLGEALNRMQR